MQFFNKARVVSHECRTDSELKAGFGLTVKGVNHKLLTVCFGLNCLILGTGIFSEYRYTGHALPVDDEDFVITGSLENYLSPQEIVPLPSIPDGEWDAMKRRGSKRLFWYFCTLRNLTALRGAFYLDFVGFAWAGM